MNLPQIGCKIRKISATFLVFAIIYSLVACQSTAKVPLWYNQLPSVDGILLGYGQGKELSEARQMAFSSIAQQFGVEIESEMAVVKQFGQHQLRTSAREITQVKVDQKLKNVMTIKEEKINGAYYVALQVDERPLKLVIEGKLKEKGYINPGFKGPDPIVKSPLVSALQSEAPDVFLDISLQRKADQWQVAIADILQPVDDLSEVVLWNQSSGSQLGLRLLSTPENRIKAGNSFKIRIDTPNLSGYVSLFNIYSDGRLTIALDNAKVAASSIIFPDPPLSLKASSLIIGASDRDTYVALLSDQRIDTTQFRKSGNQVVQGEDAYQLHKFLSWLTKQPVIEIAALNIEIYP